METFQTFLAENLPKSIDIGVFPNEGRGLVARQQFSPGEVLLSNQAFALALTAEATANYCANCANKLSLVSTVSAACMECHCLKYCSDSCKVTDKDIHSFECAALCKHGLAGLDNVRLLLRVLYKMAATGSCPGTDSDSDCGKSEWNFERKKGNSSETDGTGNHFMNFLHYTETKEPSLVEVVYRKSILRLVQSVLTDVAMATTLDDATVLATLLKLSQNSFAVYHGNQDIIGSAVHIIPSMLNHSCSPNCWWSNEGGRLTVHASKSIPAGEQLRTTYTSVLETREDRQRELRDKYSFLCQCPRCTEDEGVDQLLTSVTCPSCDKVATSNGSTPKTDLLIEFCVCERRPYCYGGKTRRQVVRLLYRKWSKLSEKDLTSEVYTQMLSLHKEMRRKFPPFSRVAMEINEALLSRAKAQDDRNTADAILDQLQVAYRLHSGDLSPLVMSRSPVN